MATGTVVKPRRRKLRWGLAIFGGLLVLLAGAAVVVLVVVYPRVGATKIRDKLVAKAAALGLTATAGDIDVQIGHATIANVDVRTPRDGDMPLVHVDKISVDFDGRASLLGDIELGAVTVDGVIINARRTADGQDNVRDAVDKYRAQKAAALTGTETSHTPLPTSIAITHVKVLANDLVTGATGQIAGGDLHWTPGELVAELEGLTATTLAAPKASATSVTITKRTNQPPTVTVAGGEVAIWPKLALSGIAGTISPEDGRYKIDLAGGYGGVPGQLWTAKGGLDPTSVTASLDLEAAKFQLEKLAPVLERSGLVDYQQTAVDANVHLDLDRSGAKFAGELHIRGLNVGNPMIADREVHDLDLTANVAGTFDRAARKIELAKGDFVTRDVPFSITGSIAAPARAPDAPLTVKTPTGDVPATGPHGIKELHLRLVIPPIDCQRMLNAFPTDMAPYLAGYRLRGVFDTDVHMDVDWADLDKTELDGHVGIKHCKVISEPSDSPKRLKEEFEHYVEVDKGEWQSFVVGPTNPDFVPIEDISPYLIKSIMSTEDSAFYQHHGFIPSEFKSALITDLKATSFRYGASSITMQMVKNVLLYREKTLARKLQELFLTWHVENTLTKDRIMEIYLNVIEYGPNLYGIGPAAQHYFGKPAKELTPVEAAFFSTILPNPKARYLQYCENTLTKWTADKIDRILKIMRARDRLTQEEYDKAIATPLLFARDENESEKDCKERAKKAIKNARSTSPPTKK